MSNALIVILLCVLLVPAVRGAWKHMRGEGGCCGGPREKVPKKVIRGPKTGECILHIEGMHCDNCKNRIERHLNELDGVVARVKLAGKTAVVSCYREVEEETIRRTVENLDFRVTSMEYHRT